MKKNNLPFPGSGSLLNQIGCKKRECLAEDDKIVPMLVSKSY
jgi:hypothetical protein